MGSWLTSFLRRARLLTVVVALAAMPIHASEHRLTPEMISAALEDQGYTIASITRTLLGRLRVIASKGLIWREVVLDLSTGQILRDYAVEFSPHAPPTTDGLSMPRGGTIKPDAHGPELGG